MKSKKRVRYQEKRYLKDRIILPFTEATLTADERSSRTALATEQGRVATEYRERTVPARSHGVPSNNEIRRDLTAAGRRISSSMLPARKRQIGEIHLDLIKSSFVNSCRRQLLLGKMEATTVAQESLTARG
ncbi:hypothetical protein TIFTF001_042197 [Ficus carica]|uniref:Uncharacterized protein n=1 Tax=Ficus carica TaxID=3494 RepID=A0AA87ZXK0_FICCA|nr:hypothetical protein TIFTF001_042197 [Ficus carica]